MLPTLQIGPLALQFPGLLLLISIWLGVSVAERVWDKDDRVGAALADLVFFSLLAGVIGARLGYVLRYLPIYLEAPLSILSLNPGTLSASEGWLAAGIVGLVYGQRRHLPLWPTLDGLTPAFAMFAVGLAAANWASGDAFGAPTSLPWAVELWGALRHPTQIYELALAIVALGWVLSPPAQRGFGGFKFLSWLALASASRLLIEAYRGDSVIVLAWIRQAQLIALLVLLAAMVMLHFRAVASTEAGDNS